MDDAIEVEIKKLLPSLEENNLKALLERLSDLGVTNCSDLSLVEEADVKDVLKTIQARRLITSWKKAGGESDTVEKISHIQQEVQQVHNENPHKSINNLDWAYDYEVPWKSMPTDMIKTLEEKKRLTPSSRKKMLRIVTDDINKMVQKPGKKALSIIARKMVKEYSSLSDTLCGEIVGEGHTSIAKYMEVRFDNMNRTSEYNVLKRSIQEENKGEKKIKISDAYGCLNWQPPNLPLHEDEESQEAKRRNMIDLPPGRFLDTHGKKLLSDTYYTQRKDINSKNTIAVLKTKWPLLFTTEGLLQHFKMLTDIDFSSKMSESLSKKKDKIYNFLKSVPCSKKNKKKMQQLLDANTDLEDEDFVTFIRLLSIYFDEDVKELFIEVDVTKTAIEIEKMNLPSTPCLICYGEDAENAKSFKLYIDGIVAVENIRNICDGFSLLFSSYYCFNIHYPKSASTTLEFVQRCFLGINPNRGSKKDPGKKQETINSKILNLVNKISEYELIDQ